MPKVKPEPVPVSLVCSLCGQDWGKHGDDPTLLTCIEVLRAELARRPVTTWTMGPTMYAGGMVGGISTTGTNLSLVGERGPEVITRPDDEDGSAGVRVPA